jgi:26S proteasome regulatory subunit N6
MASKIAEFIAAGDLQSAVVTVKVLPASDDTDKDKETVLLDLAQKLAAAGMAAELEALLIDIRQLFVTMAKAKTAKIVRAIMDYTALIPDSLPLQVKMCEESIAWAKEENRTFLRQKLELKLASLYLDSERFHDAITLIDALLKEVKKLDDK